MRNKMSTYRIFEYEADKVIDLTPRLKAMMLLVREIFDFKNTLSMGAIVLKGTVTATPSTLQFIVRETFGRGDYVAIISPKNSTANLYEFHNIHIDSIKSDCTSTPIRWEVRHEQVAWLFGLYFYGLDKDIKNFLRAPGYLARLQMFQKIADEWFDENFQVSKRRTSEGLAMLLLASGHIRPTYNFWGDIDTEYSVEWIKSGHTDEQVINRLIRSHLLNEKAAKYYLARAKTFITNERTKVEEKKKKLVVKKNPLAERVIEMRNEEPQPSFGVIKKTLMAEGYSEDKVSTASDSAKAKIRREKRKGNNLIKSS